MRNNLVPTFACAAVRDCAAVHVAAYANPSASGRYMCLDESIHWNQLADILAKVYPKFPGTQGRRLKYWLRLVHAHRATLTQA